MKKLAFTAIIFSVLLTIVSAQTITDVNLRSGRQDGVVRLVFEANEEFIKNTNVSSSGMQLHVKFPSGFNLKPQKGFEFETSAAGRLLTVYLKEPVKEPFEMKILRLSSPPRLVADISLKPAADISSQPEIVISQKVFVFDPGHGGYDFGIVSNELKEKDIVLAVVREIEGFLINKDKKVFLTRKSDQFMLFKERAVFTNQKMPDIFVSVHVSTSENFAVYAPKFTYSGSEQAATESYSLNFRQKKYLQKSRELAENLGKAIKEEFNLNVVHREMSLPVLNSVGAPAVLIEVPSFRIMNYDQNTRSRLARAIIKGFYYYGQ